MFLLLKIKEAQDVTAQLENDLIAASPAYEFTEEILSYQMVLHHAGTSCSGTSVSFEAPLYWVLASSTAPCSKCLKDLAQMYFNFDFFRAWLSDVQFLGTVRFTASALPQISRILRVIRVATTLLQTRPDGVDAIMWSQICTAMRAVVRILEEGIIGTSRKGSVFAGKSRYLALDAKKIEYPGPGQYVVDPSWSNLEHLQNILHYRVISGSGIWILQVPDKRISLFLLKGSRPLKATTFTPEILQAAAVFYEDGLSLPEALDTAAML